MKETLFSGAAILTAAMLAACGGAPDSTGSEDADVAVTESSASATEPVSETTETNAAPAEPASAPANPNRGRILFLQCRSCHTLEADGPHLVGPNLHGLFGTVVGSKEGFVYSEALVEADFEWTPEALDAWLTRPTDFLPGNKMAFVGIQSAEDRSMLIDYLQEQTQ